MHAKPSRPARRRRARPPGRPKSVRRTNRPRTNRRRTSAAATPGAPSKKAAPRPDYKRRRSGKKPATKSPNVTVPRDPGSSDSRSHRIGRERYAADFRRAEGYGRTTPDRYGPGWHGESEFSRLARDGEFARPRRPRSGPSAPRATASAAVRRAGL